MSNCAIDAKRRACELVRLTVSDVAPAGVLRAVRSSSRRLRRDLQNATRFAALVAGTPGWRVTAPPRLQTVCIQHDPGGLDPDAMDFHTRRWASDVNASGLAYVTPARVDDRWIVRVSIGAAATEWEDIEAAWVVMQACATADRTFSA